jgi:DNA-binding MarR family transcriptional regulator
MRLWGAFRCACASSFITQASRNLDLAPKTERITVSQITVTSYASQAGTDQRRYATRDPLLSDVASRLLQILKAIDDFSKYMQAQHQLSGPQLWALWEVRETPNMTMSDLAARMFLHPSTVSGIVDRLVRRQLMTRVEDPQDRRAFRLNLTAEGEDLLRHTPKPVRRRLIEALHETPDDVLISLRTALESMGEAVRSRD